MRNLKLLAIALALTAPVGCKKKKATDNTTNTPSGSSMAGSNDMGSGSSMAGSGSSMAGSNDMSGSGSAGAGSGSGATAEPPKTKEMVNMAFADMKWTPLDPAHADQSPEVASLWGDMQKGPNGFLIKVKAGSKGMWHTHSNDYHGVTIMGAPNHLQAGSKKPDPLPAPAYWFEPGKAPHNSQCLGKEDCVGLVHFNDGNFDFAPAEEQKTGKPDAKYKEVRAKDLKWTPLDPKAGAKGPQFATIWGDMQSGPNGFFIKMPAGATSPPHTHTADYHAVAIKGTVMNYKPDDKAPKEMPAGSYWFQPGGEPHITACKAGKEDCLSYVYMEGKFDFAPAGGAGGDAAGSGSAAGSGAAAGSGSGK